MRLPCVRSREKVLPPVDDALAGKLAPGKTLGDLREMIEHDIEHAKKHDVERAKESQIVKYLHEQIQFELPPALLQNETRRALAELVQRNRERGVTDEMLKEKEKRADRRSSRAWLPSIENEFHSASDRGARKDSGDQGRRRSSYQAGGGALRHFVRQNAQRIAAKRRVG